jgi:LruC domain-containing protein/choice-of-anchor A domain-containing protein
MKNYPNYFKSRLLTSRSIYKFAITGILFLIGSMVQAQSPTTPALDFNVFVKNNARLVTNQTEGPVAMGGNISLEGNYVIAAKSAGTFKSGSVLIGLVVGGKVIYTSGNQNYVNNGYVKVGDGTGSTVWYKDNNGANSNLRITSGKFDVSPSINLQTSASNLGVSAANNPVIQAGLIDFAKAFSTMQANAKNLAAFPTNIEFTNPNGDKKGTTITSVLTNGQVKVNLKTGTNVINTTAIELNSVTGNITFNNSPDVNHTLIINVNAAATFKWIVWNQAGLALQNCPYIIYNFYNTTNLQIQGNNTIQGTVFAPFADITKTVNQSNIAGQVVALSFYQSGGANLYANFVAKVGDVDTDGDGISDKDDNYPNDATRAFNNPFPASGFGTLLYEDLWPYKGDYDFNDLVINYRFNTVTNAANNVVEIIYSFVPMAAGASFKNGFAFQLDGISADKVLSITGTKMSAGWSKLNINGTEAGNDLNANVIVFDDVSKVFNKLPPGTNNINTFAVSDHYDADTITVVAKFQTGVVFSSVTSSKFNPYMIINQVRGKEVHLANHIPSGKMDISFFGQGDDKSNIGTATYFKTKNNLPWAINVTSSIPHTFELVDFTSAYTNFIKWAVSGGISNTDWYLNISGNRDASKLYNK